MTPQNVGLPLWKNQRSYAYLDTQVNKSIGKKAPCDYFTEALTQCDTKVITCGSITDSEQLKKNLEANCVPFEVCNMNHNDYPTFLEARRKLMAQKIKDYYYGL